MVQKDPELMMSPDRVKQRNHSSPGDSPRKSSGKSTRTAWLARLLRSGSFKRMSDSWERGYPSDKTLLQLVQASEAEDTCKQHQQRRKKSVAEYVPWMLPAGEGDLGAHTRRQLVMDKIGGLARSLGRPGSRTEQTGRSASRNAGNISDCASDGTDESEGRSGGQAAGAGPSGQGGSPSRVSRTKNAFQHLRQGLQHLKRKCANRSELTSHYVLFGIATPVVLFGFDAYYLMSPDPASDEIMLTVVVCVLWMLLVEFLCTCACTTAYVGSFFFYCDLVAIVSMVPEVLMLFLVDVTSVTAVFDLARAGRAARAGTRVSRLVRLITSLTAWRKAHPSDPRDGTSQEAVGQDAELKVGKLILQLISKRVISIVFVMLLGARFLIDLQHLYFKQHLPTRHEALGHSLHQLTRALDDCNRDPLAEPFHTMAANFIDTINHDPRTRDCMDVDCGGAGGSNAGDCPEFAGVKAFGSAGRPLAVKEDTSACTLRYLRVANTTIWGTEELSWEDLRRVPAEGQAIAINDALARVPYSVFGSRLAGEEPPQAYSLMVLTSFSDLYIASVEHVGLVCVITAVLLLSCMLLGNDIDMLVIAPLENMSRMVKELADNPMAKVKSEFVEGMELGEFETRMIASALIKLSSMLQIGFGEAGASIIAMNLDDTTQTIQPIVPGRRMMGLFGFCDVRNFTNATECLQEDIMVYINCIAEYCHNAVSDNGGFPNKNVGDAFLMAWPLTDGAWTAPTPGMQTPVQEKAESALRSFLRVVLETSCSHILRRMAMNEALQKRLPGFHTELGFGLHVGWAIEGAIGTAEKVDPSYLSPHVELSMKLEAATKSYGVCVLMSDTFYDVLPPYVQRLCRCIDRVQEPGSRTPIDLYTYDFNFFSARSGKMPAVQKRPAKSFWEQFPPSTSPAFRANFAKALRHYTQGAWAAAKHAVDECLEEEPDDVPAARLDQFMARSNYKAPVNWKGFRQVSHDSFDDMQEPVRASSRHSDVSDTTAFSLSPQRSPQRSPLPVPPDSIQVLSSHDDTASEPVSLPNQTAAIASKADGSARRHQEPCRQRRHSFSDPTQLPSFAAGASEVCIPSAAAVAAVAGDTSGGRTPSLTAHDPAGAPADKRGAKTKLDMPLRPPQRPLHHRQDSAAASRRARVPLLPQ